MATAKFGQRGINVASNLLKAQGAGLDIIIGGGRESLDEFTLVWENYSFGLITRNAMWTGNAMIFQYPVGSTIRNIILCDSNTRAKALTLVLQTGTIPTDTIKFMREINISLV